MEELSQKKCKPCEGGTSPMSEDEAKQMLGQVEGWTLEGNKIRKDFKLKDFSEALGFVNKIGEVAEKEGHHPDIQIHSYNQVTVTTTTHAIGGLSENDFILASKIDKARE